VLIPEEDGRYSAIARDLPGVASQGETIAEAVSNIREAFIGAMEVFEEEKLPVPWSRDHFKIPHDAQHKWILVDV
jgi:predicted RNase H-like HicB family nuclease